ncbi:uncharacterized protein BDZ83DRAFT_44407 [Colletotrichum acutatum]|uniref:Secreted protein n=1 Tax=Glomerella acutata TaxID=27357 RepID=A0AAD8XBS0_GLOAC|nr:uncharacterized protein BDZ83DRAFT_44407 [Colletotrichum acutatum]KAK1716082.1 hypothetical protein BDZ83DRAFT_44407 [Colletotrichum acutatum]
MALNASLLTLALLGDLFPTQAPLTEVSLTVGCFLAGGNGGKNGVRKHRTGVEAMTCPRRSPSLGWQAASFAAVASCPLSFYESPDERYWRWQLSRFVFNCSE